MWTRRLVPCLTLVSTLGPGCIGEDANIDAGPPRIEQWRPIVPSADMPPEVHSQVSHNNLDVVRHDGRVFFAFRTAPSHFASTAVELFVVSSTDERAWRFEGSFAYGRDLREPRFLAWNGRLWLYFALLGTNSLDFEPGEARATEYLGPESWTEPQPLYQESFIPWRARVIDGVPYLIGYTGGENIYDFSGEPDPINIHWLTTSDGLVWRAVIPDHPVIYSGGGSETDYAFLDDGGLVAVVRNEAGEHGVFGSRICRAEAGALGDWTCVDDPRKYDSPLVFKNGSDIYLVGRRNVTDTGNYDLFLEDISPHDAYLTNQATYWFAPKRCTLWRVDPEALTVEPLLDLPSKGDTCFASVLPGEVGADGRLRLALYNYTSPVDGEDLEWRLGQAGPTLIYRAVLSLPPPRLR